jgi:hypothetical protein
MSRICFPGCGFYFLVNEERLKEDLVVKVANQRSRAVKGLAKKWWSAALTAPAERNHFFPIPRTTTAARIVQPVFPDSFSSRTKLSFDKINTCKHMID